MGNIINYLRCFMMDQYGTVISHHRPIDNNIKKGFSFSKDQIIQIEVRYY